MNLREKKYILIMVILLILSIFILLLTNTKNSNDREQYKKESTKILVIVVGEFSQETEKLSKIYKNYDIIEFNSPPDISPEKWNELAITIFKMYNQYDAFIILHNPETITYTASALAFMLENLGKTVILSSNGILAMNIAKNHNIPEVIICDGDRIVRGCRSKKIKNAINSPNYPYLGKIDNKIELNKEKILQPPTEPLKFLPINPEKKIIVSKVYPGVDSKSLVGVIKNQKVAGIILESYDNGYISSDKQFLRLIENIVKNGIFVVNVSQHMNNVTDKSLEEVGVVCGGDMTTETALAKLYIILTNIEKVNLQLVKDLMKISMRGEV